MQTDTKRLSDSATAVTGKYDEKSVNKEKGEATTRRSCKVDSYYMWPITYLQFKANN